MRKNILSLEDRIKKHEEELNNRIEAEKEKELIFDELRKTDLWKNEAIKINSWNHASYTLSLSLYDITIEEVIDAFCGPLHRKYGIDWRMRPTSCSVELRSLIGQIVVVFEVHENEMQSCEIKKRITKVLDEKELDIYRYEYEYEVNCAEAA